MISKKDILAKVIHTNYRVLIVLDRMGVKLGVGNKTIEDIADLYNI